MSPICGIEPFVKCCDGFKSRQKRLTKGCDVCDKYKAFVEKQKALGVSPAKKEPKLAPVQSTWDDIGAR